MENKKTELLESEKKEIFLKKYKKLVDEYGYDFYYNLQLVKIEKQKENYVDKSRNK